MSVSSLFLLLGFPSYPRVVLRLEMANRLCVICQLWISKSGCLEPWVEACRPGCIWVQLEGILLLVINVFLDWHTAGLMASPFPSVWNGVSMAAYLYLWIRQGLRRNKAVLFILTQAILYFKVATCHTGQMAVEMFEGHEAGEYLSGSRRTCVSPQAEGTLEGRPDWDLGQGFTERTLKTTLVSELQPL